MKVLEDKLKLAAGFEEEKKYLHALQIYQSLASEADYKSIAAMKLAVLFEKMGRIENAFANLKKYLDVNSGDQRVRKFYIQFLIKHSKYSEAVDEANYFDLQKEPMIYMLVGLAYYYLEDYQLANQHFEYQ